MHCCIMSVLQPVPTYYNLYEQQDSITQKLLLPYHCWRRGERSMYRTSDGKSTLRLRNGEGAKGTTIHLFAQNLLCSIRYTYVAALAMTYNLRLWVWQQPQALDAIVTLLALRTYYRIYGEAWTKQCYMLPKNDNVVGYRTCVSGVCRRASAAKSSSDHRILS